MLKPFDSPLGPGEAFFRKGRLTNFYLLARAETASRPYSVGSQGLHALPGAEDPTRAAAVIALACDGLRPLLARLAAFEAEALAVLAKMGWPAELAPEGQQLVWRADAGRLAGSGQALPPGELRLYAGAHLAFGISAGGVLEPVFDAAWLRRAAADAAAEARRASLPPLQHKVFGPIERGDLVPLKRRKLGRRFVEMDLFLPGAGIDGFDPARLDPFVPLRKGMDRMIPQLVDALTPLRTDWARDWLEPANAAVAGPFHAAFPEAAAEGVSAERFAAGLWLERVALEPLAEGGPRASWDFRALPKGAEDVVFVARTDPSGAVLEVCTES